MDDLLGQALLDYYHGERKSKLFTETSISEEEEFPLVHLFRNYTSMPKLEQKALQLAKGKILDVGCGAGSHSLYLQKQGKEVEALDISEGAVQVAQQRGVKNVICSHLLAVSNTKYDTLLVLMNGSGIFETTDTIGLYLQHIKSLLQPGGQVLIDSSDLQYMYDRTEEGGIIVPSTQYYGQIEFLLKYKEKTSNWFPWLYLDASLFEHYAVENGFVFSIVERGEHFNYLARLTIAEHSPF